MFRNTKGAPGYINKQKKLEILKLLFSFLLVAALLILGIVTTHTRKNILTVVAILGCLPACRIMVSVITLFPYRSLPKDACDRIRKAGGSLRIFYDFVFTASDHIYPVDALAVCGHTVCGYMSRKKELLSSAEEHLRKMLRAEGLQKMTLKLYDDEAQYCARLEEMQDLDAADAGRSDDLELRIGNLFMNISL